MFLNMSKNKTLSNCAFQSCRFKTNDFRKLVWEVVIQDFSEMLDAPL